MEQPPAENTDKEIKIMRIQHNIMAMNAYRNYNNNTSALSKNLEKLSSGYKINRAGDDAAGLAISEKMRAQITGLKAASKNVKDGVSLVKTAEGALQEVHDMLNRMDSLATQSANGTYDNDVDRANLQKEVDSLRSEIDRIADSANFNGIQLLDGSLSDGSVKAAYQKLDAVGIKGLLLPEAAGGTAGVAGTNTLLEADSKTNQLPTFSVDLDGMSHVVDTPGTDDFTLEVGGETVNATGDVQNLAKGDKLDAKALAALYDGSTVTLDGVAYTAKVEGSKIVFTADKAADKDINAHYDVSFEGVTGNPVNAVADVFTTGALAYTKDGDESVTITYQDKDGTVRILRLEHLHDFSIYENSKPRIQRYRPILKYDQAQQYDRGIQYDDHIADLQVGVISNHTCQYIRTGTRTLRPENTSHTQS